MTDKESLLSIINSNFNMCMNLYQHKDSPIGINGCLCCKYRSLNDEFPCWQHRLADTILEAVPLLDASKATGKWEGGMHPLLKKDKDSWNSYYKNYKAEYCRYTGLSMYSSKDFSEIQKRGFFTKTRAKKEKVQIDEMQLVGWYRCQHGYTPLFKQVNTL